MMKVTVYNFFKVNNGYEFIKDGKIHTLSVEMMACVDRQYQMMGYMKFDGNHTISYSLVRNTIEVFMKKIGKKG